MENDIIYHDDMEEAGATCQVYIATEYSYPDTRLSFNLSLALISNFLSHSPAQVI